MYALACTPAGLYIYPCVSMNTHLETAYTYMCSHTHTFTQGNCIHTQVLQTYLCTYRLEKEEERSEIPPTNYKIRSKCRHLLHSTYSFYYTTPSSLISCCVLNPLSVNSSAASSLWL